MIHYYFKAGFLAAWILMFSIAALGFEGQNVEASHESASVISIKETRKFIVPKQQFPEYYTEVVYNQSASSPAFVSVDVYRLSNPGKEETLTRLSLAENSEIYTVPHKLVIPAGGSRAVRIYLTEGISRDEDQYYRIRFSPSQVEPEEIKGENDKYNCRSGLSLGIGFGQLLMINRTKPSFDTQISIHKEHEEKKLEVRNNGNSFIRIEDMKICFARELKQPCQYASVKHVNPAARLSNDLDNSIRTIDFTLVEGDQRRSVSYDRLAQKNLVIQ